MNLLRVVSLGLLCLVAGPAWGQDAKLEAPSAQLVNRSYCAADIGDERLAAGTTYGVLFYDFGKATATAAAPQRLEPEAPRLLLTDSVNDLAFGDGLLVVANGPSGVKLVRGTGSDEEPTVSATIDTPGAAMGVALSGRYAAVALGVMGIGLYDVGNPEAPVAVATFDTDGYARQVRFVEAPSSELLSMVVANGRGGVLQLTVETAQGRLVRSDRTKQSGDVRQVLPVPGGLAVSRGKQGVCLVPHVSRKAPQHCFDNLDVVRGLALADDLLLVGDGGEGIFVVPGLDDWEPGATVRHRLPEGSINRVYVFDDTVVIAADYYGILVFPVDSL